MEEMIKEIADRVSSYEIINNFIPGSIFCILLDLTTRFKMPGKAWEEIVIYYFAGLIIGRVGSLVIESFFKWLRWPPCKEGKRFLEFTSYESYVSAVEKDTTIDILSQKNNFYRSICAVFLFLIFAKIVDAFAYDWILSYGLRNQCIIAICVLGFVLFAWSYRKQTGYVKSRVELASKKSSDGNKGN